jgi:hypothetical protein
MGVPAGRQLDGAAGREAGTDERVESGLTTFLTVWWLKSPRSLKFGALQVQLNIVDLPPDGVPVASSSRHVMTPGRLRLPKQSNS